MTFSLFCSSPHQELHSFPTRRSSDLTNSILLSFHVITIVTKVLVVLLVVFFYLPARCSLAIMGSRQNGQDNRSEEHTSELQSHHDLVCRLLLEKKKRMILATKEGYYS